jgi:uncharacterized protein YlxW (UPF0749 family)
MDVGVTRKKAFGGMEVRKDNVKVYPSFTVKKNIGDFKTKQKVKISGDAIITGISDNEFGYSIEVEVRDLKVDPKKATRESVGSSVADEIIK